MSNRILSIDWDYITGDCQENLDSHCGFCGQGGFHRKPPKQRGVIEQLRRDWEERYDDILKLKIPRNIPIYVAECHAELFKVAMRHFSNEMIIMDFDAHHDDYWPNEPLCCGNWISLLRKVVPYFSVKPGEVRYTYSSKAVFLCRSAPWTPAEMDSDFLHLVHQFCKKANSSPIFIGHMGKSLRKTFNHIHPGRYGSYMVLEG